MRIPIIYLSGPIDNCTDEEMHGWRDIIKGYQHSAFWSRPYECLDPTDRDYREATNNQLLTPNVVNEIVENDLLDMQRSDAILVKLIPEKHMYGTIMEIARGWLMNKMIVVICPEDHKLSPWVLYHSHAIIRGENKELEALNFILDRWY